VTAERQAVTDHRAAEARVEQVAADKVAWKRALAEQRKRDIAAAKSARKAKKMHGKPSDLLASNAAKDREIQRLQEALNVAEERVGTEERETVAGSMPVADIRDRDYVHIQQLVEALPRVYETEGLRAARHFAQQTVAAAIHAIRLKPPFNPSIVIRQHRTLQQLSDGNIDICFRRDIAGGEARNNLLRVIVENFLAYAYSAAYDKTVPDRYIPPDFRGGDD